MNNNFYILKVNGVIEEFHYTYNHDDQISSNYTWNTISPDQFLSVDEITNHIVQGMTDDDKAAMRAVSRDDLILYHHGFGRWIRNTYGLWHTANPFVIPGDLGDGHPDGLSMKVIESLYDKLTKKTDAYDCAMSII